MKLVYILIIYLISLSASGQKVDFKLLEIDTSRHIPKNSKLVIVKNSDFTKVCNAVLDAGLEIEKKDADLKTIETKFNDRISTEWEPVISIRIKDSLTIITPKIWSTVFRMFIDGTYDQNRKGKPRQNAIVYAFLVADKIAKLIGGDIKYSE